MERDRNLLRSLPSVDEVFRDPSVSELLDRFPRWAVKAAVQGEIEDRRAAILAGRASGPAAPLHPDALRQRVRELLRPELRPVINATGVVIHTNLGRAPLAAAALDRLAEVAQGYSNLEYDLDQGRRGSRHGHLRRVARDLWGAEDALVVNNNAAAVLLTVSSLATGREVVVSRGELVEIGGGFRIPEVIVQGGALLREVGTTNRTRLQDYRAACGPTTGALLKVHRSNFDVIGFVEEVGFAELVELGREVGLPVVADLGSGAMRDSYGPGLSGEPLVSQALSQGVDLTCFSGDKLLGGPQAGVILGRADLISRLRAHPLMRALRPGKLDLAALEATLELWRDGREEEIPIFRMLRADPVLARRRAVRYGRRVRRLDPQWMTQVLPVTGQVGGGALPGRGNPGWALGLRHRTAGSAEIEAALRQGTPPVIARVVEDWVALDFRTVAPQHERLLWQRLGEVTQFLAGDQGSRPTVSAAVAGVTSPEES